MRSHGRALLVTACGTLALLVALAVRSRLERGAERAERAARAAAALAVLADSAFADSVMRSAEDHGATVSVRASTLEAPVRDDARIADQLATRAPVTFLGAILAARDSVLYRWPERRIDPIRVWVQDAALDGFDPRLHAVVQNAFRVWTATGIPVDFRFVFDSAAADVQVTWVDRYESRTSGRTRWAHDQYDWIVGGGIELALHQPDGRALDERAVLAIALHEVGHLLGLDHSPAERDIMSADVRVSGLSEADVQTVRLVYDLPPGRIAAPR